MAVAPPAKVKYQRTTKGRKAQKVNLMLAAAAEDLSPVPGATSPLMMQRGSGGPAFGPAASQMGGSYAQMGAGGPFMEGVGGGGVGSFQHPFYGHMHEGSPNGYFGEGGQQAQQQQHQQQMMGMRGLPSFEQDFLRGPQPPQTQHQRPFYTTAGMGGMKQHSIDHSSTLHEPDYDALHRHHVSPSNSVSGGAAGAPGVVGAIKGDANNNNCDYSEMRMFNGGGGGGGAGSGGGIKSEFTVAEDHQSSGGRLSSPMTNTNATTPDDVLEEL